MNYRGYIIYRARILRSWSQAGLCKGICTVSYLSKIETGKAEPSEEILRLLLERLGLKSDAETEKEAAALAAHMADFPHVALKGLMAIPPVSEFPGENCRYFAEMRNLFVDIRAKKYDNVSMECLSMGMSDDFTDAIAEGSTMVRIGTAIFGKRNYNT